MPSKAERFKQNAAPVAIPKAPKSIEEFVQGDDYGYRRVKISSTPLRKAHRGERLSLYLRPDSLEALKVRAIKEKRSVSDAVQAAVDQWLEQQG